jgi:hypothetical protein
MNDQVLDNSNQLSETEIEELWRSLLHKEGSWVEWGKNCQRLQKSGINSQVIFEKTGFQESQQNLVIVAAQVYDSLVKANLAEAILNYFQGPRSDVLYELRVLNQEQRASAAELAYEKKLDLDGAHNLAKAIQEVSRLSQLPPEFTTHPGDAVAYQCWKRARQKKDLQERSRLIAQGLKFAHSLTAREAIEKLLSDFTVIPSRSAPLLPLYRLEKEEELPRIIPVVGNLPITLAMLENTPSVIGGEDFSLVEVSAAGRFVPIPGWQAIFKAVDPVAIFCKSSELPQPLDNLSEEVLVVIDREVKTWNAHSYYLVEQEENLVFQWFEEQPTVSLWGQIILVIRPKRILDENNLLEPWQMDD